MSSSEGASTSSNSSRSSRASASASSNSSRSSRASESASSAEGSSSSSTSYSLAEDQELGSFDPVELEKLIRQQALKEKSLNAKKPRKKRQRIDHSYVPSVDVKWFDEEYLYACLAWDDKTVEQLEKEMSAAGLVSKGLKKWDMVAKLV